MSKGSVHRRETVNDAANDEKSGALIITATISDKVIHCSEMICAISIAVTGIRTNVAIVMRELEFLSTWHVTICGV